MLSKAVQSGGSSAAICVDCGGSAIAATCLGIAYYADDKTSGPHCGCRPVKPLIHNGYCKRENLAGQPLDHGRTAHDYLVRGSALVMPLKYAVEQRLRFIDFLLIKYGHINRSVVIDFFGIGPSTATRDFREYKKLAPDNMVLNESEKTYYRTTSFKSVWA